VNVLTLGITDLMIEHLSILESQADALRAERSRLGVALAAIKGVKVFPSAANFILMRVADPDRVFTALKERGILIKNVSKKHPLLAGCLRTTVGTPAENDAFLKALGAVVEIRR
jgi:histidinol-phosphate aminotransferase